MVTSLSLPPQSIQKFSHSPICLYLHTFVQVVFPKLCKMIQHTCTCRTLGVTWVGEKEGTCVLQGGRARWGTGPKVNLNAAVRAVWKSFLRHHSIMTPFQKVFSSIYLFLRRAGALTGLGLLNRLNRVASKPWRVTCPHFTSVSIVSACRHCCLLFVFLFIFLALNKIWGSNLELYVCKASILLIHPFLQLHLSKFKESQLCTGHSPLPILQIGLRHTVPMVLPQGMETETKTHEL